MGASPLSGLLCNSAAKGDEESRRLALVMNYSVSADKVPGSRVAVADLNGKVVRAANEINHIHGEGYVAAAGNSRRAGKLRMIASNRKASNGRRFEADASRGIGIVE
jgi:hypothetical protein